MKDCPLLVIAGPTASGKTALAVECAKEFDGEIISADSMQIYKGMSIATAKPTVQEMQGIKHYLTDFLDVNESFSVASYVRLANEAYDEILKKGKLPILAGGTGLYIDSFTGNINFPEEQTDPELRNELQKKMETVGAEEMLSELASFDPQTAKELHPNNKKRIIRAFEVYLTTGKTVSEARDESRRIPPRFHTVFVGINYKNRDVLYDRINRRVDEMLANGLVREAEEYCRLPEKSTASQAIGYKELKPYFDGACSLEEAAENLKLSTRHYAKRQLTWFNRNKNIRWFCPDLYGSWEEFADEVKTYIRGEIYG
ncbi:MAG: tRNA (adenosine(37)-N6)-dimethylallyltransferase MiaA [Ruminococcaceae bacterium]|nr:tRNA (adenosine(37)-N6)-dimethylallyltransferase MiaA [Oscillospiraceae bacterium]